LGDTAAFSFNAYKDLRALEAGMTVFRTEPQQHAGHLLMNYGQDAPPLAPGEHRGESSRYFGFQYRLDGLSATLVLNRMPDLQEGLARARENATLLSVQISDLHGVMPPCEVEGSERTFWTPRYELVPSAFQWDGKEIEFLQRFVRALQGEGVAANYWGRPLPAHPAFRRSQIVPYSPGMRDQPLRPWSREDFPETTRLLETSFVVADRSRPLWAQDRELMTLYGAAFAKVVDQIDYVLSCPYEPVAFKPPIRDDEW